jgi:hypothetical protein
MRLTLRTLLAWLDDTLSPGEVREIGKQVAESPYAQELVERIQRVTRQRRLTVPSSSGPDGADPNLVASYLDNELDQDLVPEYEKLCLTSDVHMAEVASVHQILSLVGQKAKVPSEAKNRMYHLVRGREAIAPKRKSAPPSIAEPVTEPVGPWVTPPVPSRPWIERYGPAAGALVLFALMCWAAWRSLESPPEVVGPAEAQGPSVAAKRPAQPAPAAAPAAVAANLPAPAEKTQEDMPGATSETGAEKGGGLDAAKTAVPKPNVPAGALGMTEKTDGVLLRYSPEQRGWEQLVEATPLNREDRLLGLDPFRSTLVYGNTKVDLVGETELVLPGATPAEAARLQLGQGRVVIHSATPGLPVEIQFAGKTIVINAPPGSSVGVERVNHFEPGNPESSGSVLRIYGSDGEIGVAVGDAKDTVTSPGSIVWDGNKWTDKSDRPAPAWVTDTKPTPYELQIGEKFLTYVRPDRPVIRNLVEALDDDQKDVRRLALRALRAVGDLSFISPILNTADDPVARREAIRVLRAALAQGPDAVKAVHNQLLSDYGEDQAKVLEKYLVGFTAKEARDDPTYTRLVQSLSAPLVAVRELALDNLRTLTGRDDLEYDADKPEGRGLNAWKELLKSHDLRAAGGAVKAGP